MTNLAISLVRFACCIASRTMRRKKDMFFISNIQPVEKGFHSFKKIEKELKFKKKREMEKYISIKGKKIL